MEHLQFGLEVKSVATADGLGRFTGLGSVYGNVDLHGDVVMKGAFSKSLAAKGSEVPLLWQHDTREPIGLAKLTDTDKGLQVDGEIDLDVAEGRRAFSGIRRGYVKGLSIGYDAKKDEFKDGKRLLHEVELWEMSVVTFGANPRATVTTVKNLAAVGDADIAALLVARGAAMQRAIVGAILGRL